MSKLLKDDCSSSTDLHKRPKRRRKPKKNGQSHSSHCISSIDIIWKNDDGPKVKVKFKENVVPSFPENDRADDLLLLEDSTNNIVNYLEPEEEDICFGQIQSNIVGVRYYKGTVSNKEMVLLVREPHNQFDPNAVKVLNMASQQVGHIVRQHAAALAIIMDKSLARVEGTIPYGATNGFQIPVDIHFWGSPVNHDEVLRVIESHDIPSGRRQGLSRKKQGSRRVMSSRSLVSPQQMQNELDKIFETLDEGDKITETEPCDAVATVLYPHQKQALSWMMGKENTDTLPPFWEYRNGCYFNTLTMFTCNVKPSSVHGGILADDMGLGKTLEMISLILSNFVDGKPLAYPLPGTRRLSFGYENMTFTKKSATSHLDLQRTSSKAKTYSHLKSPTEVKANTGNHSSPRLIISKEASLCGNHYCNTSSHVDGDRITAAPMTREKRTVKRPAQYVYDDDIIDNVDDTDKLLRKNETQEYHPGASTANNKISTVIGQEDDIIDLTVEDDELPDISPSSSKTFEVEDDELPDISPSSSKMFEALPPNCESATGRTMSHSPRTTLIICPLSVVSNWLDQFEAHVRKTVHILLHVYYGPNRTKDVSFLKNQDVVITTYSTLASDFKMGEASSPLHKVEWLRIVLDEGHIIRNNSAQQTKAVFELKAERKWVLTGTPIQNSIKDFWSILNFLKVHPFTDTIWWNRTIAKPVYRREESAIPRVAHLMRNLAMRRTKNQKYNGEPLVALPARRVYLEKITLTEHEREVYDTMQTKGQTLIGRYFQNETLLRNYGQVLTILMRLRQLCCHPQLIAKALVKDNDSEDINDTTKKKLIDQLLAVLSSGSDEECSICLESLNEAVITPCAHVYCRSCIEAVLKTKKSEQCPLCRGDIEKNQLIEVPKEQNEMDTPDMVSNWQSSSKVDALMQALKALRQEDPRVKSIVVSQFTSLLTILEKPLAKEGFVYSRFDGSMNVSERIEVLRNFSQSHAGSPTVLLLSLKAGGVGLNLTAASRVFLMDPAWNPASEDQCFDRCHRLGQTKDVIITKFVIEDSIEERMLELQEKKRQLMHNAFDKKISAEQNRTNRINDIKNLISFK